QGRGSNQRQRRLDGHIEFAALGNDRAGDLGDIDHAPAIDPRELHIDAAEIPAKDPCHSVPPCHSREGGNPVITALRSFLERWGYWIARSVKLVLGLAEPDPSAGQ